MKGFFFFKIIYWGAERFLETFSSILCSFIEVAEMCYCRKHQGDFWGQS